MHFNVTLPTFVSNNLPISAALGLWCYCCLPHHIPLLCFIFCKIWFPAQLWYLGSKTFPWKPILQFTSLLWYVCHRISCNDAWRWSFTFWKDWFGSLDLLPFTYMNSRKPRTEISSVSLGFVLTHLSGKKYRHGSRWHLCRTFIWQQTLVVV